MKPRLSISLMPHPYTKLLRTRKKRSCTHRMTIGLIYLDPLINKCPHSNPAAERIVSGDYVE